MVEAHKSCRKLWVTYAWVDNQHKDVDFIIGQITSLDIDVKFDRASIIPGRRIWESAGQIISDPEQCDAWAMVVSSNSLASLPCTEELYLAVDQVLSHRGSPSISFAPHG